MDQIIKLDLQDKIFKNKK